MSERIYRETLPIRQSGMSPGTYRLAQRPALPDCDLITLLHTKRRRDMACQVLVTFLVTRVFGNEMEIFSADDESSVHFGGDDSSGEDTTADGDFACERAFLVYNQNQIALFISSKYRS